MGGGVDLRRSSYNRDLTPRLLDLRYFLATDPVILIETHAKRLEELVKVATASLLLLIAAAPTAAQTADIDTVCNLIGKIAAPTMELRQSGKPIGEMMTLAAASAEAIRPMARMMVVQAYESPAYGTDESKNRAVREFSNSSQLACYKTLMKN